MLRKGVKKRPGTTQARWRRIPRSGNPINLRPMAVVGMLRGRVPSRSRFAYDGPTMRLWLPKRLGSATPAGGADFAFMESPTPLIDGELELVEPAARWIDAVLLALRSPASI